MTLVLNQNLKIYSFDKNIYGCLLIEYIMLESKHNFLQKVINMVGYDLLPKLVRAAYSEDLKAVENISISLGRQMKKDYPKVSEEILKIVADRQVGGGVFRSVDLSPAPVDEETHDTLVEIEEPLEKEPPVFADIVNQQIEDFVEERSMTEKFLQLDIVPPNSILLYGKPGVGKTYCTRWLANRLGMPLVTVDLASTISSYLGRSGQNVKKIFEYTKRQNCLLFLDEIDAIAKKRDDDSDLGDLKRLVNVLLKELEDCPVNCVIIGATNHPELLDRAIWRRFDRNIEIPLPEREERKKLFDRYLKGWAEDEDCFDFLISQSDGMSAADICRLCNHIKRQMVMNEGADKEILMLRELCRVHPITARSDKIQICRYLKKLHWGMTARKISEITGIPAPSVSRYIKGNANG